jgi:hypothetical protein
MTAIPLLRVNNHIFAEYIVVIWRATGEWRTVP